MCTLHRRPRQAGSQQAVGAHAYHRLKSLQRICHAIESPVEGHAQSRLFGTLNKRAADVGINPVVRRQCPDHHPRSAAARRHVDVVEHYLRLIARIDKIAFARTDEHMTFHTYLRCRRADKPL